MVAHFLVEFYVLHDLECECKVAKENMHPEKTNDTKVAQHPVKWALTILSDDFPEQQGELWTVVGTRDQHTRFLPVFFPLAGRWCTRLSWIFALGNREHWGRCRNSRSRVVRPWDGRKRNKNTYRPALAEHDEFIFCFVFDFGSPRAEDLVLIDELIDNVPEPLFWKFEFDGAIRVYRHIRVSMVWRLLEPWAYWGYNWTIHSCFRKSGIYRRRWVGDESRRDDSRVRGRGWGRSGLWIIMTRYVMSASWLLTVVD